MNVTVPHPVPTWTEFLTLVTRQDPSQMVSISSEEFLLFYNSLWRQRSLIVMCEYIVNKSANGLGGYKSGNSVQGENPPVCI